MRECVCERVLSLGIDKPIANNCCSILKCDSTHWTCTFCNEKEKNRIWETIRFVYSMRNSHEIHQPSRTFMHLNFTKGILPWVPVHENTDAAVRVSILLRFSLMNSSAFVLWHSKNLNRNCSTIVGFILQSLSNIWNAAGCFNGNSGSKLSS